MDCSANHDRGEDLARTRAFVLERYREYCRERGREAPTDLKGACKFTSLFALAVFGGRLEGNWMHQYVVLDDGIRIDLTNGDRVGEYAQLRASRLEEGYSEEEVGHVSDPYQHDPEWWLNEEHAESLNSCLPRVQGWLARWQSEGNSIVRELPSSFAYQATE